MKTAAPDQAADLTRYPLYLSSNEAAETQFIKASFTLNMCACVYLLASIAIRILPPAPSRFIMSSNCPGGGEEGVI